eukprot:symbB.v1.2.012181.t1/scaffold835.1/size159100/8
MADFDDAETLVLGAYVPEGPEPAAAGAGEDGLLDLSATIPGVISGESGDSGYAPSTAPELAPKLVVPETTEVAPEMSVDAVPEKGVKRAATLTLDMGDDLAMDTGGEIGDDENEADIRLGPACTSVGRDDTNTIILDDPRVSAEQFRVHRKVNSDGLAEYELEDCSRNGTLLNKKLLHKDGNQRACLQDQDLLEVLPASKVGKAAAITFLFHAPSVAVACLHQAAAVKENPSVQSIQAPSKKRRLTEGGDVGSKSELGVATCAICQEVMHRATSVQPCLHSFCSSCLGGWLKRPGGIPRCPICRQAVAAVGKNHALDGLIEGLLKAHPEKQRTLAALADLDDRDPLHDNGYDLVKLRGAGDTAAGFARLTVAAAAAAEAMDADEESAYSDSHSHDSEEEDAEPAHAWTEPGAVRPPCAKCGVPAWRPLSSAAEAAVCHPMAATALTKTALGRNTFEEEILQEWLGSKGLSLPFFKSLLLRTQKEFLQSVGTPQALLLNSLGLQGHGPISHPAILAAKRFYEELCTRFVSVLQLRSCQNGLEVVAIAGMEDAAAPKATSQPVVFLLWDETSECCGLPGEIMLSA